MCTLKQIIKIYCISKLVHMVTSRIRQSNNSHLDHSLQVLIESDKKNETLEEMILMKYQKRSDYFLGIISRFCFSE